MSRINNTETIKRILDDAGIQTAIDKVPQELTEKVLPVLISNPIYQVKSKRNSANDQTSALIHSTSSTKRTFLIGASISCSKDVVSDSIKSTVSCTLKGAQSSSILTILYEPTTAASNLSQNITFPIPVELEKGTNINVTNSTATASIDTEGFVYYYEV